VFTLTHLMVAVMLGLALGAGFALLLARRRDRTRHALRRRMETSHVASRLAAEFLNCSPSELDARLVAALGETADLTGADRSYLGLFNEDRTRASITHEWTREGVSPIGPQSGSLLIERFPWVSAHLLRNELLCVDDIENAPPGAGLEQAFWRTIGTRAIALLPMTFQGEVRGFWGFSSTMGPKKWQEEDIAALRITCELFATALERKRREEDLRRNQERLALAIETSEAGVYEQGYPEPSGLYLSERATAITGHTAESVRALLPSSGLWFLPLVHPEDRRRAVRRDHEFHEGRTDRFRIECRLRHAQGHWRHVGIWARPVERDADQHPAAVVGVLFDISERKALEEELKRLATTDSLTGARNRRFFMSVADEEMRRARRYNRPLAMLMMDIDHFKAVNDTHGHPTGDETLRAVTRACISILRENDRFGRLGGEEFAAILPETTSEAALEVAERLRVRIAGVEVPVPGNTDQTLSVTVSIGVATRIPGDADMQPLLQRADKALYAAKTAGRNRVILA
jgi:diguanylate cyclase (GGDEF)-like protein/PAS domain S-box-containing protein